MNEISYAILDDNEFERRQNTPCIKEIYKNIFKNHERVIVMRSREKSDIAMEFFHDLKQDIFDEELNCREKKLYYTIEIFMGREAFHWTRALTNNYAAATGKEAFVGHDVLIDTTLEDDAVKIVITSSPLHQ
jgi:hypothetical protein